MVEPTKEEATAILQRFDPMFVHLRTITTPQDPMLLAHYTSVEVVEQILRNSEIWFANPLYMNDLEEMRLGILVGSQLFPEFAEMAGGTADKTGRLTAAFNHYVSHLQDQAALDTYIFCVSEFDRTKMDGLLSMWREYGSKGNGAALVFNTQKINYRIDSPLLIAKVMYASYQERVQQLRARLAEWVDITTHANLPDDRLYLAAYAAFNFIKSASLATKHHGFAEEREWRVIYVPERDPRGYLTASLDYFVGSRGIEPKLKYKFGATLPPKDDLEPKEPLTSGSMQDLLEFILLGPTVSSPLAKLAFIRMLERNNMSAFADRVFPSTIPLRPQP